MNRAQTALWETIKWTNICIVGVTEKKKEKGAEEIFEEIITETFPNLMKDVHLHSQESKLTLNKMNSKRSY